MKCPHCGNEINIGSILGSVKSRAKNRAAKRNGKLGGRPPGSKNKKKRDVNQVAHAVVSETERLTQQAQHLSSAKTEALLKTKHGLSNLLPLPE